MGMPMPIGDRLAKQETLREWLRWQLDQTERTIRELKTQQAEEQRRQDVAQRELPWNVHSSLSWKGTRRCAEATARTLANDQSPQQEGGAPGVRQWLRSAVCPEQGAEGLPA
ncbi:hypothetical protein ACGFYZ_35650 [Streptomyces sp. NPDC048330]|uniref:hypothetical protein n=1 Tax=Streptomyces sp. NPDC048330 TaxID=3365533 RepID=UPI003722C560